MLYTVRPNRYRLASAVCYGILGGIALFMACCAYVLLNVRTFSWLLLP